MNDRSDLTYTHNGYALDFVDEALGLILCVFLGHLDCACAANVAV